jgi:amino acid transporter
VINVVQLVTLVGFSIVAIFYRGSRAGTWVFHNAVDVIRPHSVQGVLIQSTLAILILVGFESCTALAAETKDAHRNIPRAVMLSLVIQGAFAYLLEYFSANYIQTNMTAAAGSAAPIGDLAILIGNRLFMISIAVTVVLALLGTTLSCINTAARVSYAMARDREMPELLGALHGRFASPARAVWALVAFSCVIAAIGVQSVVGLTGIALASNFGTFALYGMTCLWTYVAFARDPSRRLVRHAIVPVLGLVTNAAMLAAILYFAGKATYICFGIAGAWALVSIAYVAITSLRDRRPFLTEAG